MTAVALAHCENVECDNNCCGAGDGVVSDDDDDEASRVVRELEEENRRMRSARLDRQMSGDAGARGGGAKTDRLSLGV